MIAIEMSKANYFVCDSVINRMHGILSARLCWPTEHRKDWSRVMLENRDCFERKMWPQVVTKLEAIMSSNEENDTAVVVRLNECLFALVVLKELDVLTRADTQYFESVLDMFDAECVTFGSLFYLKMCSQFKWRSIVAKMISDHKNCIVIMEAFVDDIDANYEQIVSNGHDIYYFYTVIECAVVRALFNSDKFNEQKLVCIYNRCRNKLNELRSDHFESCLVIFNAITSEMILNAIKCFSNQNDNTWESFHTKLNLIEDLVRNTFETVTNSLPNSETLLKIEQIQHEINVAHDNYESILLINKKITKLSLSDMQSIECYYQHIKNCVNYAKESRFECLSNVIVNKLEGYKQLIEIIISFGNCDQHLELFKLLKAKDINKLGLIIAISTQLKQTTDLKSKNVLNCLLREGLICAPTIDLSQRLQHFGIRKICDADSDRIKKLFNQITNKDVSLVKELSVELQIGIYFDPFPVYDLIMNLALYHNKGQIELLVKIMCEHLSQISLYAESNDKSANFLMKFIVHKLVEDANLQTVDSIMKLITAIQTHYKSHSSPNTESILPLDQLFYFIIRDDCLAKEDIVWLKLLLLKQIIELSGDQSWTMLEKDVVPTIAYIILYLDYFWRKPSRKQLVVDILNLILKHKMTRNLTESELTFIHNFLSKRKGIAASTYKIYLAYLECRFPKPIQEVIDITNNIYHDQILHFASITSDFMWICNIYPEYQLFNSAIKEALEHILPSLIATEWQQLFYFLRMYYYNIQVVGLLRGAIFKQTNQQRGLSKKDTSFDINFMVHCLVDIVSQHLIIPLRDNYNERPLNIDDNQFLSLEIGIFKSMASFDYLCLPNEVTLPLKEILLELTFRMKKESIDPLTYYNHNEEKMPPIAKQVIRQVFGDDFFSNHIRDEQLNWENSLLTT